jgi:K+-transporting ATPase ATPase B chain
MTVRPQTPLLADRALMTRAVIESFKKLNPVRQLKSPVMFVVLVTAIVTTGLTVAALLGKGEAPASVSAAVSIWLWFTVLFANFAEALAKAVAARRPMHSGAKGDVTAPA